LPDGYNTDRGLAFSHSGVIAGVTKMASIVVFAGEYDLNTKSELREELSRLYYAPDVVLNMSGVKFLDSTFISELMLMVRSRREKGLSRVTVVTQTNSVVKRLFEVSGIAPLFNVVESYSNEADGSARAAHADFGRSRDAATLC
jgi:anti-anti-sigma factor